MKTDGTANPVTLTLGDKLKIIDELEGSAVRNLAETGRKYKVSRPTISKLWKDRESVKKDGLETENKERKRKRSFKEEDNEQGLKIWLDQKNEQHARVNAPVLKEKAICVCCLRKGGNHAISGRMWRAQFFSLGGFF